jgi:hypothetical protein
VDVFAVFLPYSGRIFTTKGGIGDIPIENIYPLGRNLSVEKLLLSFFFSRFFKRKLSFFPGGLVKKSRNENDWKKPRPPRGLESVYGTSVQGRNAR